MNASATRFTLLTCLIGGLPLLLLQFFSSQFYFVMNVPAYLVFHNIVEFFSVMVSLSIFGVSWYSYEQSGNRHTLFLGSAFLGIGLLDFMHALGYSGMSDFVTPNSPLKSTEYWIAARLFMATAFVISAYIYQTSHSRWINKAIVMTLSLFFPALAFIAVTYFPGDIPATYIPGIGLTPFKTGSEYLIILMLIWAFAAYWFRCAKAKELGLDYFLAGLILCIYSEFQFSSYQSVFDSYNIIGHLYKIVAFFLIYKGIFSISVKLPYILLQQSNQQLQFEISEHKKSEQRIVNLVHFDQLTGLPNRMLFHDHLKYALSLARHNGNHLAVMYLDLDHFKDINDSLGHSIGDQLLLEIARRLKATLRAEDTLSRQGGDEFMLLLPNTDANDAALIAAKLIEVVSQTCHLEPHQLIVTASIGIAIYPHDGETLELLTKNADVAMYRAKQEGRNDFRFFAAEMHAKSSRNLQLANALRHALQHNELELHYQPQLSMLNEHIIGTEALLRWQHPELGTITPSEFIPIAESTGQIIQIGEWVLRKAVSQLKSWLDAGMTPMVVSINLSAVQFRQPNLPELITSILNEIDLPNQYLELELTEAATMENPAAAIEMMNKLHQCGIRMSIDDFGTGYSSLSYLKKFMVYKLKIDQSFVRDLTDDPEDKAIVTAIINMASSIGIKTIAEGVETQGQLDFLRLQGCDEVQGYYFSKPLTARDFEIYAKNGAI